MVRVNKAFIQWIQFFQFKILFNEAVRNYLKVSQNVMVYFGNTQNLHLIPFQEQVARSFGCQKTSRKVLIRLLKKLSLSMLELNKIYQPHRNILPQQNILLVENTLKWVHMYISLTWYNVLVYAILRDLWRCAPPLRLTQALGSIQVRIIILCSIPISQSTFSISHTAQLLGC